MFGALFFWLEAGIAGTRRFWARKGRRRFRQFASVRGLEKVPHHSGSLGGLLGLPHVSTSFQHSEEETSNGTGLRQKIVARKKHLEDLEDLEDPVQGFYTFSLPAENFVFALSGF